MEKLRKSPASSRVSAFASSGHSATSRPSISTIRRSPNPQPQPAQGGQLEAGGSSVRMPFASSRANAGPRNGAASRPERIGSGPAALRRSSSFARLSFKAEAVPSQELHDAGLEAVPLEHRERRRLDLHRHASCALPAGEVDAQHDMPDTVPAGAERHTVGVLLCVFHVIVGAVSTASWARIPRDRGQGFHVIAGTRVRVPETGLPTI